jgi:hypothetical protein
VTLVSLGFGYEEAMITELRDNLGVEVAYEGMPFEEYFDRLEDDAPAMWSVSWVADYPGPNDFLGLLLGSGRTNTVAGRRRLRRRDRRRTRCHRPGGARGSTWPAHRPRRRPVVAVDYGAGWALCADGLRGAGQRALPEHAGGREGGAGGWSSAMAVAFAGLAATARRSRGPGATPGRLVSRSHATGTAEDVDRAEILITSPSSLGPLVTPYPAPADGSATLQHTIVVSGHHLYPNTGLVAQWRLVFDDGTSTLGPEASITYADDRFAWQTVEGDIVRVHWYEGSEAFGRGRSGSRWTPWSRRASFSV